jgi:hypothetical protein
MNNDDVLVERGQNEKQRAFEEATQSVRAV